MNERARNVFCKHASLGRPTLQAVLACAGLLIGSAGSSEVSEPQAATSAQCHTAGPLVRLPDVPETSGIAPSRRVPSRLWIHNDSGEPVLFAVNMTGSVTGRLRLTGATVEDWEAVAVGPCPAGSCIYVADIGDNDAERERVTVYRLTEPAEMIESANVSAVFHATYPDGPQNAESLLIAPDGRLYIVTKGDTGPIAVYRFPREPRPGDTVQLEQIGTQREAGKAVENDRITDGAVSPDGNWIVLRTNRSLIFHVTAEFVAGTWRETRRVDLAELDEPQGEGVAFGPDNTLYLAGEGGGKSKPGTLARVTCAR